MYFFNIINVHFFQIDGKTIKKFKVIRIQMEKNQPNN